MKKLILVSSVVLLSSLFNPSIQASELETSTNQKLVEKTNEFPEKLTLENELLLDSNITPFAVDIGGGTGHYLYETSTRKVSIKQQNKQSATNALLLTVSGLSLGYLGYVSLSTLTTVVGAKSAVDTLFTGDSGAQFAINVKTYIYKSGKPTSTYWGYGLIVFSNAKTGKSLTTKKITIGKTG